jgi:23S rRNA pseudouridine1911/1915/1917 synthase
MTAREFHVCELSDQGLRLDLWLATQLPELSRSHLQKLIEQGHVQVNQQVCDSKKQRLQMGDRIQVSLPKPQPLTLQPEAIPLVVLYEDDQLLIVNKPAGLVVHPAPGHYTGTLVHALLAHCQQPDGTSSLSGIGGVERPGIVHRLDKDTSGVMAIAKTDLAHRHLQAQIAAKTAIRDYLAVVHGHPPTATGTIDRPMGRHPVDRIKRAIVPETQGGRRAVTHWQIQQRLGNYTLVHLRLGTGRTHQIRVHCADSGWPIVGDPLYSRGRSVGVNLRGQALHAWQLTLTHPISHQVIQAQAPLPESFQTLLQVLQQRD